MSVWIKICGITNSSDAITVADSGVDAIGFILWDKSKRFVDTETAVSIVNEVLGRVETVGVFVDEDIDVVNQVAQEIGLDYVQLHGTETVEYAEQVNAKVIKAIRVKGRADIDLIEDFIGVAEMVLLDSFSESGQGGTGEVFDWSLAISAVEMFGDIPIILSGGLNSDNINDALSKVKPYGVDVSSGVEESPGVKDLEKVEKFMTAVKEF